MGWGSTESWCGASLPYWALLECGEADRGNRGVAGGVVELGVASDASGAGLGGLGQGQGQVRAGLVRAVRWGRVRCLGRSSDERGRGSGLEADLVPQCSQRVTSPTSRVRKLRLRKGERLVGGHRVKRKLWI